MDIIDKNIFELIDEVSIQIKYLTKVKEKYINNDDKIKLYEFTILNFISRLNSNLKGLKYLLEQLIYDEFLLVPINSIMRTISSDGLTLLYLMSFLSDNLTDEQTTFRNELNSTSIEHHHLLIELIPEMKNTSFYNENSTKLKKRFDFHSSSSLEIIGDKSKLSNKNFLTEKDKKIRVNYCIDEKIGFFNLQEIQNSDIKNNFEICYFSNKWFSQYYHYNHLNSNFSTNKTSEFVYFEIQQISKCLKSTFSTLCVFTGYLK
jgi:hypothetical protein